MRPVLGHTLCGRHARSKKPVLWVDVHRNRHAGLVKAQAQIRGYLVRRRLALAGPGVLRRTNIANDEDLVTTAEVSRISPFEYFGFTENGKTWAFELPTLFGWVLRSANPTNPYTKVPLSTETRNRLFHLWSYRLRHRQALPLPVDGTPLAIYLSHIFVDHGFVDISPSSFTEIPKVTWLDFFWLLQRELVALYPESSLVRRRGLIHCRRMAAFAPTTSTVPFSRVAQETVLRLLSYPRDPYVLCFTMLSCFYRC